jgi:phosphatidylserine/phosphatidylglycerophosphate/cardiolipin synthase-like enzyme
VPILSALKAAHARGVDVEVIVDKTSARQSKSGSRYSATTYLTNAGIPVWVDAKVAIAHNKVMVVDGAVVITGSFNFTAAAQKSNPRTYWLSRIRSRRRSTGRIGSGGSQHRRSMPAPCHRSPPQMRNRTMASPYQSQNSEA